eukprot:907640-Rhodomonas_salina.2
MSCECVVRCGESAGGQGSEPRLQAPDVPDQVWPRRPASAPGSYPSMLSLCFALRTRLLA